MKISAFMSKSSNFPVFQTVWEYTTPGLGRYGLPFAALQQGFNNWRTLVLLFSYVASGLTTALMVKKLGAVAKSLCVPIYLGGCYFYAVHTGSATSLGDGKHWGLEFWCSGGWEYGEDRGWFLNWFCRCMMGLLSSANRSSTCDTNDIESAQFAANISLLWRHRGSLHCRIFQSMFSLVVTVSISQQPPPNSHWKPISRLCPGIWLLLPDYIPQSYHNYRRKFRSETSDNMDSWKAEVKRVRREKIRRKKMQMREKVGKSRNTVFFQWFGAPEGRKVGSLKRRVRSQLARWEMKNCTPLWREAHFQVKMYKTPQRRTTFGSWDVEKVHAVVARSTFRSQNVKNTPFSDHFWKLRCWKSARRCGAKHISKSKCTKPFSDHFWKLRCRKSARRCGAKHISKSKVLKTDGLGPLLEVQMSKKCRKKCTPLWREAHFEVKSVKNWGFWPFFDVKMSKK